MTLRVFVVPTGVKLNLNKLTIGNGNAVDGAGVYNDGTLTVTNSTFSGNSAGQGGGIGILLGDGPTLRNTIVANSPSGGNCANFVSLTDGGGNLDSDGTCVGTISPDPLLGPLQNNGGPTQTMAISMASPAFGGADPAN